MHWLGNLHPGGHGVTLSFVQHIIMLVPDPKGISASSGLSFMCCKCRERSNWTFYGVAFSCSQEAEKDSKVGLLD
ncbi:hypothetical protein Vadar_007281 [Vaccinium darrowii]|uniref:Uncharacterized protein n=1 Tax=Vaccinium darrowii TaxID=229202 RepID=A0ACB7Y6S6_9ERIC|nr:hypothetical protein Vadar_007281 [Vaccinium darrowii]